MTDNFTTHEVARILKLSDHRLRSCLHAALYPTRRTPTLTFTFQDLLLLKTTKNLLEAHLPVARIRRMLESLKRQLPPNQQLWNIRIYADGRRVVVWDGNAHWQPDSGQYLFNFEPQGLTQELLLKPPTEPTRKRASPFTPWQWFQTALELEESSPEEARQAYRQALEMEPSFVDAHINLGRLYHEANQLERAEACYRSALQYNPNAAYAHFNLGVLLEDCGQPAFAIEAYRKTVACDAAFAEAHYNLALLYEALGQKVDAIRHFGYVKRISHPTGRRVSPRRHSPDKEPVT